MNTNDILKYLFPDIAHDIEGDWSATHQLCADALLRTSQLHIAGRKPDPDFFLTYIRGIYESKTNGASANVKAEVHEPNNHVNGGRVDSVKADSVRENSPSPTKQPAKVKEQP